VGGGSGDRRQDFSRKTSVNALVFKALRRKIICTPQLGKL
jgi:hypothetical protein